MALPECASRIGGPHDRGQPVGRSRACAGTAPLPVAAIVALERASSLNPHHAAIAYDLGYALQHNGDFEAAMANYRRAIAANPRHGFALYNLAFLLQERHQRREASNLYARAAEIMPDNPHLLFNWSVLLQDLGDAEHALELYRRIVAAPGETRLARDARAKMAGLEAMKEP